MPALVDFIDIVNICTYLLSVELLTFEERNEILELKRKHLQVPQLFYILTKKGSDWYMRFRKALITSVSCNDVHLGHKDLLTILPPTIEHSLPLAENELRRTACVATSPPVSGLVSSSPHETSKGCTKTFNLSRDCDFLADAVREFEKDVQNVKAENKLLVEQNQHLKERNIYLEERLEELERIVTAMDENRFPIVKKQPINTTVSSWV